MDCIETVYTEKKSRDNTLIFPVYSTQRRYAYYPRIFPVYTFGAYHLSALYMYTYILQAYRRENAGKLPLLNSRNLSAHGPKIVMTYV